MTAMATFCLLGVGGLVTSHGVGMAVPDWPNTYGYNMFLFPISKWVGGVFYEHSHRLAASGVGLLTTVLALWLYGRNARPLMRWAGAFLFGLSGLTLVGAPGHSADGLLLAVVGLVSFGVSWVWPRCEASPKWLRRLGLIGFAAVVFQGVLGGLRVVLLKDEIGIFHATLAQLFFALSCALALFTSRWWQNRVIDLERAEERTQSAGSLAWLLTGVTALILCQLILGATMRHQHAGVAIPDFPLAYGKVWPATDASAIDQYNQHRLEITALNPITAFQIILQMVHRLMALLIVGALSACVWLAHKRPAGNSNLRILSWGWLGLILVQALLGAATIWSNKAADVATGHVLVGALSLAFGAMLSIMCWQDRVLARRVPAHLISTAASLPPLMPQAAVLPAGSRS
jgi:cytochrome c oxidase assembly protein subunit 15